VAEGPSKTPDPIYERHSWRDNYEAELQAMRVEIEKREKAHSAYLEDFLVQNGRLPSLQEDKYGKGLEMFTNRLVPALQRGQKRQRDREDDSDSEDDSKDNNENDGEDGSKDHSAADSEDNNEDDSKLDDGALEDSELDPEYKDY